MLNGGKPRVSGEDFTLDPMNSLGRSDFMHSMRLGGTVCDLGSQISTDSKGQHDLQ